MCGQRVSAVFVKYMARLFAACLRSLLQLSFSSPGRAHLSSPSLSFSAGGQCRRMSGPEPSGAQAKEHPMMYSPKAQRFVPLSTKQVASAVWNRTVQPYSTNIMHMFAPLHRLATAKACELLQDIESPHLLDIGSAAGEPALSVALALPDSQVVSTDFSGLAALGGRQRAVRAHANNIIFQFADAEDLQFDDDSFDLVMCCLVRRLKTRHMPLQCCGVEWHAQSAR